MRVLALPYVVECFGCKNIPSVSSPAKPGGERQRVNSVGADIVHANTKFNFG